MPPVYVWMWVMEDIEEAVEEAVEVVQCRHL